MDQATLKSLIEKVVSEVVGGQASNPAPAPKSEKPESKAISYSDPGDIEVVETGVAERGTDPKEVVIGLSPAFGTELTSTIIGLKHGEVLRQICAGIEEEGLNYRFIKVYRTADVAFIGLDAAKLSGSGIGIGLQSRGTSIIHQRDLAPLSNLELFSQAPLMDLETFRALGRNAAQYAKGLSPNPVPIRNDQMARPKYQAVAALLHNKETRLTDTHKKAQAVTIKYK
ncbi:propanediol/glycerol family dehydratase medium subunit [Propionimicrobium lymphophilum]|uniref:propanediol/glycerol family dehydratase medium subunit n=1 Tax=Propionimicrobium lymphophilum TaxID=33012 RepID=UPI0023EF5BC3|nr:propanediol/glycerol family dehydratase medium subunit [Propionimicrobium lymphophilum]